MATIVEERIARLEAEMDNLVTAFELHERRQDSEFQTMSAILTDIQKQLSQRLPTWATLLLTGMGTIIGVLIGVLGTTM